MGMMGLRCNYRVKKHKNVEILEKVFTSETNFMHKKKIYNLKFIFQGIFFIEII
jgi:hypothetical protein